MITFVLSCFAYLDSFALNSAQVLQIAAAIACVFFTRHWFAKSGHIKGIPIIDNNSILGYTKAFLPGKSKNGKYDSHEEVLEVANRTGKLAQFSILGHKVVLVNDKTIAKYSLERVHGKGYFHRGNPHMSRATVFNMDTNAEWKVRRSSFRHSFNSSSLREFQDTIRKFSLRMCEELGAQADAGEVVPIDELFGRLTVDVIGKLGFQYELGALEGSAEGKVGR